MNEVRFRRSDLYKETYLEKIQSNPKLREKFRTFMELKRSNPNAQFGAKDENFTSGGPYIKEVPGIRKARITLDINVVYKLVGNEIYLYGFFTHKELGTGQPANINREKMMAKKFATTQFA